MINVGDKYYDLAKLFGGMTISYQLIKNGHFTFDMSGSSIFFSYLVKNDLIDAKEMYLKFIKSKSLNLQKIKILTSLIFLNMSPLHQDPFDHLIYFLGKKMLFETIT